MTWPVGLVDIGRGVGVVVGLVFWWATVSFGLLLLGFGVVLVGPVVFLAGRAMVREWWREMNGRD